MNRHQHTGFTLLELLIALAIFSLVSILSFSGLNTVLDSKEKVDQELDRLAEIQRSFFNLSRDIEQIVNRPVRDELGTVHASLTGGQNIDSTIIEFTRTGWRNPAEQPRSYLQRVAYGLEDKQLIRLHWFHVDHLQSDEPARRVLLDKVSNIEIKYLKEDEWHETWPPLNIDANFATSELPLAVEITLELEDWGPITRLFKVIG